MADPIRSLRSHTLVIPLANIDTDQIIPARMLTTTSRHGLGEHLFADVRGVGMIGEALSDPRASRCQILVAGDNFGCGSSREHAPWALLDHGFRAVISTGFADIFAQNAIKNGLLPVVVEMDVHRALVGEPWAEIEIDLPDQTLRWPDGTLFSFSIDAFAKQSLLTGVDELDWLLDQSAAIDAFEEQR